MIADLDDVKDLCINVRSVTTDSFYRVQARIADSIISGRLVKVFAEWTDALNGDIEMPQIIKDVAALMTAGRVEKTKYAVNEAGKSSPNPYGVEIYQQGAMMLDEIYNGSMAVAGWTRFAPVAQAQETGVFSPVGGLRSQGGNPTMYDPEPYRIGSDDIGNH